MIYCILPRQNVSGAFVKLHIWRYLMMTHYKWSFYTSKLWWICEQDSRWRSSAFTTADQEGSRVHPPKWLRWQPRAQCCRTDGQRSCRRQQGREWRDQLLFACVCKGKQAQYELPEPLGSCHLWISLSASRESEFWLGLSCNAPWTSNWACDPPNPKTLQDLICLCLSVVFVSVLGRFTLTYKNSISLGLKLSVTLVWLNRTVKH